MGDRSESAGVGHPTAYNPPYTKEQPCQDTPRTVVPGLVQPPNTVPPPLPPAAVPPLPTHLAPIPPDPVPPIFNRTVYYDDCPPADSLDDAQTAAKIEHRHPKDFFFPGWPGDPYVLDESIDDCVTPRFWWGQQVADLCFSGPSSPGQPKHPYYLPPPYEGPTPNGPDPFGDYCNPFGSPLGLAGADGALLYETDQMPTYLGKTEFLDAGEGIWLVDDREHGRYFVAPRDGEGRYHIEANQLGDALQGVPTLGPMLGVSDDPDNVLGAPDGRLVDISWDGYMRGEFRIPVQDLPVMDGEFHDDDRATDLVIYAAGGIHYCLYGAGPESADRKDGIHGPYYLIGSSQVGSRLNQPGYPFSNGTVRPDGVEASSFDLSYYYTPTRMTDGIPADEARLVKYVYIETSPIPVTTMIVDFDWSPRMDDSLGADTGATRKDIVRFVPHVEREGEPLRVGVGMPPRGTPDATTTFEWCFGLDRNDLDPFESRCDTASPTLVLPDGTAWPGFQANPGWYDEDEFAHMDNFADRLTPETQRFYSTPPTNIIASTPGIGDLPHGLSGTSTSSTVEHRFSAPGDYTVCLRVRTEGSDKWFDPTATWIATFDNPQVHVRCRNIHIVNQPPLTDFAVRDRLDGGLTKWTYQFTDLTTDPDWVQAFSDLSCNSGGHPANWKSQGRSEDESPVPWTTTPPYPDMDKSSYSGRVVNLCGGVGAPTPDLLPDAVLPDESRAEFWDVDEWSHPERADRSDLPVNAKRYDSDGLVEWSWDFGDGTGYTRTCWTDVKAPGFDLLKDSCPDRDVVDPAASPLAGQDWVCQAQPGSLYSNTAPDCHLDTTEDILPDDEYDIRNPRHTYPEPGMYIVTLRVTDADGGQATMAQALLVPPDINHPPLVEDRQDLFLRVGQPFRVDFAGQDPDSDHVEARLDGPGFATFTIGKMTQPPAGLTTSATATGLATGVAMETGTWDMTFSVTDGEFTTTKVLHLTVFAPVDDSDNDGLPDLRDVCPNRPAINIGDDTLGGLDGCPRFPQPSPPATERNDTFVSSDIDGDGFPDHVDLCPSIPDDQADLDGDDLGDACDLDIDGDGVPQSWTAAGFATDDCPLIADPLQVDTDADGAGDVCDDAAPLAAKLSHAEQKPAGSRAKSSWDLRDAAWLSVGFLLMVSVAVSLVVVVLKRDGDSPHAPGAQKKDR